MVELCDAIIEVQISQPKATTREVHAELAKAECWTGLTFPEVKKACSKLRKQSARNEESTNSEAISPGEPTKATSGATDNRMDARHWLPWPGLGTPPMRTVDGTHHPLAFCFREAVPLGIQVSLGLGRPLHDVSAEALWKSVLYNVVGCFAGNPNVYRVMVQGPDERLGLLIDMLSGPFCCPPSVPTHFTKWDDRGDQTAGQATHEPAILVRFLLTSRDDSFDPSDDPSFQALVQTSPMDMSLGGRRAKKECPVMMKALHSRGIYKSSAAELRMVDGLRTDVIQAGFEALLKSTNALSSSYKNFFDKQSPYHAHAPATMGRFKPGFLVPPPEHLRESVSSQRACAVCAKDLEAKGTAFECACDSIFYCSKKCQTEHWPTHKKVCRKNAAQLRSRCDPNGRKSLVMPMLDYSEWLASIDINGGGNLKVF